MLSPFVFAIGQLSFCLQVAILVIFEVAANFGRLLQSLPVASNCWKLKSKCFSTIQMHQKTMELVDASIYQLQQFAAN